ncbi:hypothetical protein GCM10010260_70620 [Streptomyces filipinensis]|uniref:Uncharacterized protein n=1 Tax=Streptomyces filipinensis TaxID=66887 RepID=A0A918IIG4_9ACTN|nr:hypothetical protein [Streptomyces filipinensis]GGV20543.1 hypothetical protein GCM10010260_70620 [Streptomyces filipinensis]
MSLTRPTARRLGLLCAATVAALVPVVGAVPAAVAAPAAHQGVVAGQNPGGTMVRTEQLASGGGFVEIYRVSASHYWGRIVTYYGTSVIDANGETVAGQDNGEYVFLTPQGHFGSWIAVSGKNQFRGPGTFTIARGYTAVVEQTGRNQWRAKLKRPAGGAFLTLQTHAVDDGHGGLSHVYAGEEIVDPGGKAIYVVLSADGIITSFDPQAATGGEPPADKCTATRVQSIGAGTLAHMSNRPSGPRVSFTSVYDDGKERPVLMPLDRNHPSLPADAGIVARIKGANTAAPKLVTRVEGGKGAPEAVTAFPAVPKDCRGTGTGTPTVPATPGLPVRTAR